MPANASYIRRYLFITRSRSRQNLRSFPTRRSSDLVRPGEHVDRVLDRDRAETLQPAPHLDPEVVGLGRDLVDEQDPAVRSGLRHRRLLPNESLDYHKCIVREFSEQDFSGSGSPHWRRYGSTNLGARRAAPDHARTPAGAT